MQLFLSLFFDGSVWELADIVISFYRSKGIPYEEAHQVNVNKGISFQLYPGCDEEMFSQFIAYLCARVDGDMYLDSEWDDLILLRRQGQLWIEKAAWKKYLEIS